VSEDETKKPKTQKEFSGEDPPKPPRPPTVGEGDFDFSNFDFERGQKVRCRINQAEKLGYSVSIVNLGEKYSTIPCHLGSHSNYNIGDELTAAIVCVSNQRLMLADLRPPNLNLLIDQHKEKMAAARSADMRRHRGMPPAVDPRIDCATNLIMPPLRHGRSETMRIGDSHVNWLTQALSSRLRSQCLKTETPSRSSRAALLLWNGRIVGCIHVSNSEPTPKPTTEALEQMLVDLYSPDTVATVYELPEGVVLALSSLFLGNPIEHSPGFSATEYVDFASNWLEKETATGTLTVERPQDGAKFLILFHRGSYLGTFSVREQSYHTNRDYLDTLLKINSEVENEGRFLPTEPRRRRQEFGIDSFENWYKKRIR